MSALLSLLLPVFTGSGYSQFGCHSPEWLASPGFPGTDRPIKDSTLWDPDGDGPAHALLVVCGDFRHAGDQAADYLAFYDPIDGSWKGFDNWINGPVTAVAVSESNELIIGGVFTAIGNETISGIATWDGNQFEGFGSGVTGEIQDIVSTPEFGIVVAGTMSQVGTLGPQETARWDGNEWKAMPLPYPVLPTALHLSAGGELFLASRYLVARWNGSKWDVIGMPSGAVSCLTTLSNGDLLVGGDFHSIRVGEISSNPVSIYPITNIARWDGHKWHEIGTRSEIPSEITSIVANGDTVMAGTREDNLGPYVWTGDKWKSTVHSMSNIDASTLQLLPDGRIAMCGDIRSISKSQAHNMAIWDGFKWDLPHKDLNGPVTSIDIDERGQLVFSGDFTSIAGRYTGHIAVFDGNQWRGYPTPSSTSIRDVLLLNHGVIAALSTNPTGRIMVHEGSGWAVFGTETQHFSAMARSTDGKLFAGRTSSLPDGRYLHELVRFEDNTWVPLAPPIDGFIRDILNHDGRIYVATNQSILFWDGSNWTTLVEQPFASFDHLLIRHDGSLAAVGPFQFTNDSAYYGVAIWDGQKWRPTGTGVDNSIQALVELPDKRLLIGGWFQTVDGEPMRHLAVWDGSHWEEFAGGASHFVESIAVHPDGTLYVGGYLGEVDTTVSPFLARYGCPAPTCTADTNGDGMLSPADFSAWVAAFNAMTPACDQNGDGSCTPADFSAWVANYNAGCE